MKYCERLLYTVHLFPEYITPCIHGTAWRSFPRFPYSGGTFDAVAYRSFVMQTLEAMQKEGNPCTGCLFLKKDATLSFSDCMERFKIRWLAIEANQYLCNLRCIYCYSTREPQDHREYYELTPFFRDFFSSAIAEVTTVTWIEGEPTLSKDFPHFCREFHEWGLNQFFLTNATKYSPEIAQSLAAGKGHVFLSLDSGSRETYATIKGVDVFETVRTNARLYSLVANGDSQITLKYILMDENANFREILFFLLHCVALRTQDFALVMELFTIRKHAEPDQWILIGAFAIRAGEMLQLRCDLVAGLVPPRVCTAIETTDLEAFANEQGVPGVEECILPLLASAAREIGDYLEYDAWEDFPGWVRDGERGLFVADINTREAFAQGVSYILADHGGKAFIVQPYACTFVPRGGSLDCSLDEYRFRKTCICWGHIFSDEELQEAFAQASSANVLERLLQENAQAKHLAVLQAWSEKLQGKEVFFWGCGAAYEAHKELFSKTKPKAVLLSLPYAEAERRTHIGGLPILSADSVREQDHSLPVVVFSRLEHARAVRREVETLFNQATVIYALLLDQCNLSGAAS